MRASTLSLLALAGIATAEPNDENAFRLQEGLSTKAYTGPGYEHPHRPQFHFTSQKGWLNDPNGMVFDGEKYYLFFQHNPKGKNWGNISWGHATSTDMIHWEQQDHALMPYWIDGTLGLIFSGTAVVDHNNTLGQQKGDTPTLAAFYTFAAQPWEKAEPHQGMAYSTDRGQTWTYHNEGRAVVQWQGYDPGERDPKVLWHEESQSWAMALWIQKEGGGKKGITRFFTSQDLVNWEKTSDFERPWVFECMDLVQLPVDGDPKNKKWLIYDASFEYEIGDFDGREFTSETPTLRQQRDKNRGHYYAAQTFNHSPDGRSVIIGWMRGHTNLFKKHKHEWNQQMSFPANMTLRTTEDGPRLFLWPIKEIEKLVTKTHDLGGKSIDDINAALASQSLDLLDIRMVFDAPGTGYLNFDLQHNTVRYNADKRTLEVRQPHKDKTRWVQLCDPIPLNDGKADVRLLVDRMSIEAFVNEGAITGAFMTDPALAPSKVSFEGTFDTLLVRELKSTW